MKKTEIIYISTGTNSGYYHYAVCLLSALSKKQNINIRVFFTSKKVNKKIQPPQSIQLIGNALLPCKLCRVTANWMYTVGLCVRLLWNKVDVVHINTIYQPSTTLLLLKLSKFLKIKTILTVHEKSPHRLRKVGKVDQYLRIKCRELVDVIIVHSNTVKDILKQEESIKKITIIEHGNYNIFKNVYGQSAATEKTRIVFFGIKKHKGIDAFMEAIVQLANNRSDFEVVIAGATNSSDNIKLDRMRSISEVRVLDKHIPDDNLGSIFTKGSVAVMPYIGGDTSGALHLALSYGCCPIVSNIPYFSELLKDNETALFVREVTAREIMAKIIYCLDRPADKARIAVNAYNLENSLRFSWDKIASEHVILYEE